MLMTCVSKQLEIEQHRETFNPARIYGTAPHQWWLPVIGAAPPGALVSQTSVLVFGIKTMSRGVYKDYI